MRAISDDSDDPAQTHKVTRASVGACLRRIIILCVASVYLLEILFFLSFRIEPFHQKATKMFRKMELDFAIGLLLLVCASAAKGSVVTTDEIENYSEIMKYVGNLESEMHGMKKTYSKNGAIR